MKRLENEETALKKFHDRFWDPEHVGFLLISSGFFYLNFKWAAFLFPCLTSLLGKPGFTSEVYKFLRIFQWEWLALYSFLSFGVSSIFLFFKIRGWKWIFGTVLASSIYPCFWLVGKGVEFGLGLKTFSVFLWFSLLIGWIFIWCAFCRKWNSILIFFGLEEKAQKVRLYFIENPSSYFIIAALFLILCCAVLVNRRPLIAEHLAKGVYVLLTVGIGIQCIQVFFGKKDFGE